MKLFYFLIIIPLWMLALDSTASLKVLLCQEGISLKNEGGIIRTIAPGDALETGGILEALKYPAYIALYDSLGKFGEKKILQPTPVREIELALSKTKKKPFATTLINFPTQETKAKRYLSIESGFNPYKTLSHLKAQGPYRCPSPSFQILGNEKCKAQPKAYTLYIHSKDTTQHEASILFKSLDLMDKTLESITFLPLKRGEPFLLDLNKPIYKDQQSIILHLENDKVRWEECDKKFIEFLNPEELSLKNSDVKKLKMEFTDQSSPLSNYLMAMVLEDHKMYLDSAELYIKVYSALSGSDKKFNEVLYNYLLSTYRIH